jgi:hypothetical protein
MNISIWKTIDPNILIKQMRVSLIELVYKLRTYALFPCYSLCLNGKSITCTENNVKSAIFNFVQNIANLALN